MSTQAADNEHLVRLVQSRLRQRGESLAIDSWAGAETLNALDRQFPARQSIPAPANADDVSAAHYALARQFLGIKEQPGSGTNPLLAPMWALCPDWLDKDDSKTAWCGIFRGYIGHRAGSGLPPNHYRALEWSKWGKGVRVDRPALWQRGDTVVMPRTGGNHVALLDRVEGGTAYCLGGNQSDAVTIAPFKLSRIAFVRR